MIFQQDQQALQLAIENMSKMPGRVYKHLTDDDPSECALMDDIGLVKASLRGYQLNVYEALQKGNASASDIAGQIGSCLSTARKHLRLLVGKGLAVEVGFYTTPNMVEAPIYGVVA